MFANLKPYPGQVNASVPSHWTSLRLGAVGRLFKGSGGPKDDDAESGSPCIRYGDLYTRYNLAIRRATRYVHPDRASAYTKLQYGDVLFAASGETIEDIATAAVNLTSEPNVLCGGDLVILRPTMSVEPVFLSFAVNTPSARLHKAGHATGTMIVHIDSGALKNIRLALPPLPEQAAIIKYLAHANARIDRAIAAKRKMVALLDEEKQAFVDDVIARAGNATQHVRLKNVATVQTGLTLGKNHGPKPVAKFPYLRVANVQAGQLDLNTVTTVQLPPGEASRYKLQPMDVLMTEGGDIDKLGRACIWRGEIDGCLHQNHVFAVRCGELLDPVYLVYLLGSTVGRDYFYRTAKRTTNLASTNSRTLGAFSFALPSITEQRSVLERIHEESSKMASLAARVRREIGLLGEFKTRLTTDVVTGQVDVREIAATLPDVDPVEAAESVGAGVDDELEDVAGDLLESAEP